MNVLAQEAHREREVSQEEVSRLVRRAQNGETEAFGDLFEILEAKLHRQAFFLAGDEHQAVDLLQETMIEVWKHVKRYDGRARFFTWVCSVMTHRQYDWLRRLRVRTSMLLRQTMVPREEHAVVPPDQSVDQNERAHLLRECLEDLPPGRGRLFTFDSMRANHSKESPRSLNAPLERSDHGYSTGWSGLPECTN